MEERPQHEKRIPEYTVTVNGEERHYPAGTTMKKVAEDVQESYPYRIILGDIDENVVREAEQVDREFLPLFRSHILQGDVGGN